MKRRNFLSGLLALPLIRWFVPKWFVRCNEGYRQPNLMAGKGKVLVVDDELCIRKYLRTLLEVDGFGVDTVSSGREALERVKRGYRPDFITLDVLMPEMNGIVTLRELLRIDPSLSVIMLSCLNEVGTVVEAVRSGAHDYLTYPCDKRDLDMAMEKSRQKRALWLATRGVSMGGIKPLMFG